MKYSFAMHNSKICNNKVMRLAHSPVLRILFITNCPVVSIYFIPQQHSPTLSAYPRKVYWREFLNLKWFRFLFVICFISANISPLSSPPPTINMKNILFVDEEWTFTQNGDRTSFLLAYLILLDITAESVETHLENTDIINSFFINCLPPLVCRFYCW